MARLLAIALWCLIAGGVIYFAFHPETGLGQQGAWAAVGIGLVGAAVCQHASEPERSGN